MKIFLIVLLVLTVFIMVWFGIASLPWFDPTLSEVNISFYEGGFHSPQVWMFLTIVLGMLMVSVFFMLMNKANYKKLTRFADFDDMTGIYNIRAFYRKVKQVLDDNPGRKYVLVRWDIDRFKVFNDMFGVRAGDKLLADIGAAIKQYYVQDAIFAHIGADHFVICLPEEQLDVQTIFLQIKQWFDNYPISFEFMPCMGIYLIDEPDIDVSLMCDRALLALRAVKGNYCKHIGYYDEELRSKLMLEQEIVSEISSALEQEQFEVYFQPQYNYADDSIIGAEALVRWNHPTKGMLSPAAFVPVFEKNGYIFELDVYVWEQSCKYLRRWLDMFDQFKHFFVSVNISRADIYHPRLCGILSELVEKYNIPAYLLKLEITETAYVENPVKLIEIVNLLHERGFIVAMDDFGSGYSSLNTLKDVPVDELKLDLKFLAESDKAGRGGKILSLMVRMARWLEMPVTAEGVETKAQADFLKSIGCMLMQGYFFARPMPVGEFDQLIKSKPLGHNKVKSDIYFDLIDMNDFWDANAQSSLIFNSYIGGAAILEYANNNLEVVRINDNFFKVFNINRAAYSPYRLHILDTIVDEDRNKYIAMLEEAIRTGKEAECSIGCKPLANEGSIIYARNRVRLLARNQENYIFYALVEDITDTINKERKWHWQAERYRLLIENTSAVTFDYDVKTDVLVYYQNCPGEEPKEIVLDKYFTDININPRIHPDFIAAYREVFLQAINQPLNTHLEYKVNFGLGFRWSRVHLVSVADEQGQVYRIVGRIDDICDEKQLIQNLHNLQRVAEKDGLTGIYNRFATEMLIKEQLSENHQEMLGALFMLDLDDFKLVNDTLGHLMGDALLKEVAAILTSMFRERDVVGRIGGDEFIVFLRDISDVAVAEKKAEQMLQLISAVSVPNIGKICCSIGVTLIMPEDKDFNTVYDRADYALYIAKNEGKNNFVVYDSRSMGTSIAAIPKFARKAANTIVESDQPLSVKQNILINYVFRSLYRAKDQNQAILDILAYVGKYFNVSCVYIFENNDDDSYCRNTFEWCNQGVAPQIDILPMLSYEDDLGEEYAKNFDTDGVFYCQNISILPEKYRARLESQGVKSMLQCAINDRGHFRGFVGFDECQHNRFWLQEQVDILIIIAQLISTFLSRKRQEDRTDLFSSSMISIFENHDSFVFVLDPLTFELVSGNKMLRSLTDESVEGKKCYSILYGRDEPCVECPICLKQNNYACCIEKYNYLLQKNLIAEFIPIRWNGEDKLLVYYMNIN